MPKSEKSRKKPQLKFTDAEIKIQNAKSSVLSIFKMIEKTEQNTDNAYLMLTLICNCTMNLELNNLADLDQIMGAVNLGMKSAIEERAARALRNTPKKQRFII